MTRILICIVGGRGNGSKVLECLSGEGEGWEGQLGNSHEQICISES